GGVRPRCLGFRHDGKMPLATWQVKPEVERVGKKRWRAAALQDAAALSEGSRTARSVLECASPLALWEWRVERTGQSEKIILVMASISMDLREGARFDGTRGKSGGGSPHSMTLAR
ncbi:MAG TPA: hypothetical protein VGO57_19285, partial [Verrucomicrobiae bacterium]